MPLACFERGTNAKTRCIRKGVSVRGDIPVNRPTYLNEGWTASGITRKRWALENERCAWCGGPLPKHRRIYCSRNHALKFADDPRYHKKMLLWSRIRAEVLWEHKICQNCRVNPSSEVDHIKEIALGGDPFDKSNLQALCSRCHKEKTARFLSERAFALPRMRRTSGEQQEGQLSIRDF